MRSRSGFTLLEVMIATALLAVGALSVLMVLATGAGFASRRTESQRQVQVLEEARFEARAAVNAFRPPRPDSPSGTQAVPGEPGKEGRIGPRPSSLYAGYSYELKFAPVDRAVPEAGYRVEILLRWGDGQELTDELSIAPDVIDDEEFRSSITYDAERRGTDDRGQTREKR